MIRCSVPLLFVAALACHSAGAPPAVLPKTNPVSTDAPLPTVALTSEWSTGISFVRRDSIILSLGNGQRTVEKRERSAQFAVKLTAGMISIRLETLAFTPAVPIPGNTIGTTWNGRVDANGRISQLRSSHDDAMTLEVERMIAQMLPHLPRAGATIGSSWKDTTSGKVHIDVYQTDEWKYSTWSVGTPAKVNALQLTPVTVRESFEQLGKGSVADRSTTMSAQGGGGGTWYLTAIGRVDHAELSDSAAKLVTISGTRDPIATMEYTRTTIRYSALP